MAGIIGAGLSHVIADLLASLIDPHLREMVAGIVVGGVVPLFAVPFFEQYIQNHEKTEAHDDKKKNYKPQKLNLTAFNSGYKSYRLNIFYIFVKPVMNNLVFKSTGEAL